MSDFVQSLINAQTVKDSSRGFGVTDPTQYSYADIKDLQDFYAEQNPTGLLGQLDTGSFSRLLQTADPNADYSLGFNSGVVKDISNQVHRGFRALGINAAGSALAGSVGSGLDALVGNEEGEFEKLGSELGEGLGRGIAQIGAVTGGIAAGPYGIPLVVAGIFDAGAQGFTETDSVGFGLANAALAGLAPGIGKVGANLGLKVLGKETLAKEGVKAGLKRAVATEIGQEAAFFTADAVVQGAVLGENPFSYENLMANVIGNVSMAPVTIPGVVRGVEARSTKPGIFEGVMESFGVNTRGVDDKVEVNTEVKPTETVEADPISPEVGKIMADKVVERVNYYNTIVKANNEVLKRLGVDDSLQKDLVSIGESAFGLDQSVSIADLSRKIETADDVILSNRVYNNVIDQLENELRTGQATVTEANKKRSELEGKLENRRKLQTSLEGTTNTARKRRVEKQIAKLDKEIGDLESTVAEQSTANAQTTTALARLGSRLGIEQDFGERGDFGVGERLKGRGVEGLQDQRVGRLPRDRSAGQVRFAKKGAEDVYGMIEGNMAKGDSPVEAVIRAGQQMQGQGKVAVKQAVRRQTGQSMRLPQVLSDMFDTMGTDHNLKGVYVGKTLDVVDNLDLPEGMKYTGYRGDVDDMYLGWYAEADRMATINTNRQSDVPFMSEFNAMGTVVHESIHGVIHKLDNDMDLGLENRRVTALRDAREYARGLSYDERFEIIGRFYDEMMPKELRQFDKKRGDELAGLKDYAASDPEEFLVEFAMLTAMSGGASKKVKGVGERPGVKRAIAQLPEPIKNFVKMVFKTADELFQLVRTVVDPKKVELFDQFGQDVKSVLGEYTPEVDAKTAIVAVKKPIDLDQTNTGLSGVKFRKTGVKKVDAWLEKPEEYEELGGFFRKLGSLQQLAHTPKMLTNFPTMREVIDTLTRSGGETRTKHNAMLRSEMVRVDSGILKPLSAVSDADLNKDQIFRKGLRDRYAESDEIRVGFSEAVRLFNDMVNEGKEVPTWDSVKHVAKDLSEADQNVIKSLFDSRLEGGLEAAGLIKAGYVEELRYMTAQIFQKQGMSNEDSLLMAQRAVDSVVFDREIPADIMSQESGLMVAQFLDSQRDGMRQLHNTLDRPFFSEMRVGKWNMRIDRKDGEKAILIPVNTKGELKTWQKKAKDNGWDVLSTKKHDEVEFNEFDVVPSSVLQRMITLSEQRIGAYEKLTGESVSDEFRSGANNVIGGLREEIKNRKQFLAERKFAAGREYIDMLSAQDGYYSVVSASITKKVNRAKTNFLLSSPEWNRDPALRQELKGMVNNLLNKDQKTFSTFNKMTTVSKMGLNFSSAFVDSTQNITMGIPTLAHDSSITTATKYVSEGYKEAIFSFFRDIKDPEFREIVTRAHDEQHLLTGSAFEEAFSTNDVDAFNVARAADHKTLVNTKEALTNREFMWYKTMDLVKKWSQTLGSGALTFTKISAQINNKTTLYAAYRIGKDRGLKGTQLYDYALSKMQAVNIQGGRAATSTVKLTESPTLNAALESGTLLTKYPIAYLTSMIGNYQSALKSSGLDSATRRKSAGIFATQLGIGMTFAGAMGGLGISTVSALVKQLTGYDFEQDVQENLAELTNPAMADVFMNGLLNQTGIDFASRFKIGGLAGVSDYNGFESKDVFHAGGSFIESIFMLPEQLKNGDLSRVNILPPGIRKMITSIGDEGKVYDKSGELVMDMNGRDNFFHALGFRPTKLSYKQKQASMLRDIQQADNKDRAREHVEYADDVLKGNFARVAPIVESRIQPELEVYRNSGLPPAELTKLKDSLMKKEYKKFIDSALSRVYESDPFEGGSAGTASQRARVQNAFGRLRVPRSLQAEKQDKAMELLSAATGKPLDRRSKTIRTLRMIDRLIQENPSLTRSQARAIAQQRLSDAARYGSTLEPDLR